MSNQTEQKTEVAGPGFGGPGRFGGPRRSGGAPKQHLSDKQIDELEDKLKALHKQLLPQALAKAAKLGVPADFAKDWLLGAVDNLRPDFMTFEEAKGCLVALKKDMLEQPGILNDYNRWQESEGISEVKRQGEAISRNPSQKIKLLQKMGLTGAEFHALCLMIKEQIR